MSTAEILKKHNYRKAVANRGCHNCVYSKGPDMYNQRLRCSHFNDWPCVSPMKTCDRFLKIRSGTESCA